MVQPEYYLKKKHFFPYFSQSAHIQHTLLKHIGFFSIGHKNEESCTLNVMHTLYTIRSACHCMPLLLDFEPSLPPAPLDFLGFPTEDQSFSFY